MKILMVLTNGFDPDVRVYKEAEYILAKGHSVEILCWDRNCEYKEYEQLKGINIRRFPIKSVYGSGLKQIFSYAKFMKSIIKYIKKNPCDLIHFHDLDGAIPSLFIRKRNMKYIFDMHELYINGINKYIDFVLLRLLHIVQNKADKIIYVTDMQLKFMKKNNVKKCLFLPNYPSAKIFSSIKKNDFSKLRIAYIGSARDFKSLKILIDATKKHKNFQFRIDGMGSEYANLKKYSEENNFENILTGKYDGVKDIEEIYKNTDLLYCAYDNENENWKSGISVKFYEGIITHTPIIVNKGGEEEKMVVKYDIGYVIDINNPSSFDNLLDNISHSDSYKRKIESIQRIDHLFDWDHIVGILDNIYE